MLLLLIGFLGASVTEAVVEAGIDDASTRVERSWLGQKVQIAMLRLKFDEGLQLFGRHGSAEQVSAYILLICGLLAFAATAATPAAIKRVAASLEPKPPKRRPQANPTPTPNATPAATPSPTPAAVENPPAASPPTYADLCGPEPTGRPAPASIAAALRRRFLGAGAIEAGCAQTPQPVTTVWGTWVMPGMCAGRLSSLAVAAPDGSGELLLGQGAAEAGTRLAREGRLQTVSQRVPVGSGDFYLLGTPTGNELLIRRRAAARPNDVKPASCEDVPAAPSPYVQLPPHMTRLWMALNRHMFTWPRRTRQTSRSVRFAFVPDASAGAVAATGGCSARGCWLRRAGGVLVTPDQTRVTTDSVLASAG